MVLPKYDCMRYDRIFGLDKAYPISGCPFTTNGSIAMFFRGHGRLKVLLHRASLPHEFFNRRIVYGSHDDGERFTFFSRAAMEFMFKTNKHPDIIHCHDWQTALMPVLLYEFTNGWG